MKQSKPNEPMVILPPPVLAESKLTDKYNLRVDLSWGDFKKEIVVSKEQGSFTYNVIQALNAALLEGSESKPYILS